MIRRGPGYFLTLLSHRAFRTPHEQYWKGIEGLENGLGDYGFIKEVVKSNTLKSPSFDVIRYCTIDNRGKLKEVDSEEFGNSVISFDEKSYGATVANPTPDMLKAKTGLYLPKATGMLVLKRQQIFIRLLNLLVDKILWSHSKYCSKERSKPREEFAQVALAKISLNIKSTKPSFQDLLALVLDRNSCLEEYQYLARNEPAFLEHCVHVWWHSRLERIGDRDNFYDLASESDDTISVAFFRVFHDTSIGIAI